MRSVQALRHAVIATISAALLAGCTAVTGKTTGQAIDDAMITAAVKSDLAAETFGTVTRIDVDTNEGTVYLNGTVENATAKTRAVTIARQVDGVREVVDNLKIQAR